MKNLSLLFFYLISICFLFSCKEDKCKDVNCYNGGVCIEGNGKCSCVDPYTGENCLEINVPSSVLINQFYIRPYDLNINGETWDLQPGEEAPDVYIKLLDQNSNVILDAKGFELMNVTDDFTLNYDWNISDVTAFYTVQVFDEDYGMSEDDLIFEFTFQPFTGGEDFPETIEKEFSADGIPATVAGLIRLKILYNFN